MRKFQSVLAAAALLGGGLVAGATTTASADPYPGSVNTTCKSRALNNPGGDKPARVRLKVTTGGNGAARGRVVFQYKRKSNGAVAREYRRSYFGPGKTKYEFDNVPRGRYRVKVFFNSRPGASVYQNCRKAFSQRVR
jgi:hypothetical protein